MILFGIGGYFQPFTLHTELTFSQRAQRTQEVLRGGKSAISACRASRPRRVGAKKRNRSVSFYALSFSLSLR